MLKKWDSDVRVPFLFKVLIIPHELEKRDFDFCFVHNLKALRVFSLSGNEQNNTKKCYL